MLLGLIEKLKTPQEIQLEINKRKNILTANYNLIKQYHFSKKQIYDSVIPLKIYQTWHTKKLPPLMRRSVIGLIRQNPKFEYHLFDDKDCRDFIKQHFDLDVLNAFDRLIPGAYKADLWRYCVLYINGGIYLDIKYGCANNFHFIELTEKEHWVLDINKKDIYNALIAVKPQNEILFKCIRQIVDNVKNKFYGSSCLDPTGPSLLSKFIGEDNKSHIELNHVNISKFNKKYIFYKNVAILKMYPGYYKEQEIFKKVPHYVTLWNKRKIYR
jgi:mannosyltransferase OCH1-like enzyme